MMVNRLRSWPNLKPTVGKLLVSALGMQSKKKSMPTRESEQIDRRTDDSSPQANCLRAENPLAIAYKPHQVWQSDHWSDRDNRCALKLYEQEGYEQHKYSLWRHRFTDCSVEGHTLVILSGLSELAREKGGRVFIAYAWYQESASSMKMGLRVLYLSMWASWGCVWDLTLIECFRFIEESLRSTVTVVRCII